MNDLLIGFLILIIGACVAVMMALIIICIKTGKKDKTSLELDWRSPFPEEDGYTEVDLDELIEAVRKNPSAAAAEYNHKKVIFKGKASVSASGNIDVKGMLQESKGYRYYIYSAYCTINGDRSLFDIATKIDNNIRTAVYVKGVISSVLDYTIYVETIELACFEPDKEGSK